VAVLHGRIVKTTGDGMLVEFGSVVDAVRCAIDLQRGMTERNAGEPEGSRIEVRIGINLGDIIIDTDDIHGDGVNIAARLEALAEPGSICISQTVLDHARGKIPFDVEDGGAQALKNIAQPVHIYRVLFGGTRRPPTPQANAPALALPDKPSIAVLPFQNMSGDPEQEFFSDGMAEDIITALSKLRWFFVIARNSTFVYKGKTTDVRQVARELGVRYVLEGSVRKAGNRVRITAQLVDATTGNQFRGSHEHNREALRLLRRAIEIDPQYAAPYGLAAYCYVVQRARAWVSPSDPVLAEGIRLAKLVASLGQEDSETLWMAGHTLAERDLEGGIALIDRALALNPNSANAWRASGLARAFLGDAELAIAHLERSVRLSPLDVFAFLGSLGFAWAHFMAGRYEEASTWCDKTLQEQPDFPPALRMKAATCGLLGRLDEGRAWVERLLAGHPHTTVSSMRLHYGGIMKKPGCLEAFLDGLRKAGLPE
jgi:adenylate cyclase